MTTAIVPLSEFSLRTGVVGGNIEGYTAQLVYHSERRDKSWCDTVWVNAVTVLDNPLQANPIDWKTLSGIAPCVQDVLPRKERKLQD